MLFLTGPGDDRGTIVEGIRAIAEGGREQGVPVALEGDPARVRASSGRSSGRSDEAAALVEEAGEEGGLMYDSWHLWREPVEAIERHRERIRGVHLADWRGPKRNTNDRVLPGDGVVDFEPILEALRWDGFYDLEIFSDAGAARLALAGGPARARARAESRRLRRTVSSASA